MAEGIKYDDGKIRFDLLDPVFEEGIAKVLTFGASKYSANNWRGLARFRIERALKSHINAYRKGERFDPETEESHLYHAACNLMFLDWFDRQEDDEVEDFNHLLDSMEDRRRNEILSEDEIDKILGNGPSE